MPSKTKSLTALVYAALVMVVAHATLAAGLGVLVENGEEIADAKVLESLIARPEQVEVSVDVAGSVLWADPAKAQFVLRTDQGALRVKNFYGQPIPAFGKHVRLSGHAMAGQGVLDQALVDNDGIHSPREKSGTVYLKAGRHPICAEWFNGPSDYLLAVEYAGPGLKRQPIPSSALYRQDLIQTNGNANGLPGLNFGCYEGDWQWLPQFRNLVPVKAGIISNFDLGIRSRNEAVGIQYTGYLDVVREGPYKFWLKSDDGSRLFVGSAPLHVETLEPMPLAEPRAICPGQALQPGDDYFLASVEGVVTGRHVDPGGDLELELSSATNRMYLLANAAGFHAPELFSRVRATGLCHSVRVQGRYAAWQLLLSSASQVQEFTPAATSMKPSITSLADLRRLTVGAPRVGCLVCLTGAVVGAVSPRGYFGFQDATAGVVVAIKGYDHEIKLGQEVELSGYGIWDGNHLTLNYSALLDNNYCHGSTEVSGACYLTAGRHPIHVSWFNWVKGADLELWYQGPGLKRRRIPDAVLFHPGAQPVGGPIQWLAGLNYACYNGEWGGVCKTGDIDPVTTGVATNFDIRIANRPERVGLEFGGFLDVAQPGLYFFSDISDDGSLMFIDEQLPSLKRKSLHDSLEAFPVVSRQVLGPGQNNRWSETEGLVKFVSERAGSLFIQLDSAYGPMSVQIVDGAGGSQLLLLGAQVKVQGFCVGSVAPNGQNLAAAMVAPGMKQLTLLKEDPVNWGRYPLEPIGKVAKQDFLSDVETLVHVRGAAYLDQASRRLRLQDVTGGIEVDTMEPLETNAMGIVEAIGRLGYEGTNVMLNCGITRQMPGEADQRSNNLPLLTTIQQIKQLTRPEAMLRYPVKVRGVVTLVRGHANGVIIQDDTSAIDVWWPPYSTDVQPIAGDCWEITGETSVKFSPIIESRRAVRCGVGRMPEPLHPAWDQVLNGSLDTRYVEVSGIVTATESGALILFTSAGKVKVMLNPVPGGALDRFVNARVRIRGCVVPSRDEISQRIQIGEFRLSNMSLSVDEPPPADLFAVRPKHVSDLLLFDAQAASLQRVKIQGQVLHEQNGECFVIDGESPIRVVSRERVDLEAGMLVEAVGYPKLNGGIPVLLEAILRPTGRGALPNPIHVVGDALFTNDYDGRLVSVDARVTGISSGMWEKVLEMRIENREFLARLNNRAGGFIDPEPGSWVKLTGVYSEQGVRTVSGKRFIAFDLLLDSPAGLQVLARPPWWTLPRALMVTGGMVLVVLAAMFWIVLLRRRVAKRTKELEQEMNQRVQFQRQNELERERSRIAKDMHDQLGTNVTQIGLLAELTKKHAGSTEQIAENADRIFHAAFELGRNLDEIVWAVNPKNDSLDMFCDYLAVQSQEYFQLTNILCRVDLPPEMPGCQLSSEVRHNLYLATREALNNVVRHAAANEVWIRFTLRASTFQILIIDDGIGFVPTQEPQLRNGLQNMKHRMEDAGGSFTITSQPNHGTVVTLTINLNQLAGALTNRL